MLCYYEMTTPIMTDITEMMGEALPEIELTDGMTNVTFSSETGAAVPAEVLYRYPEGTEVPPYVDETVSAAALMSLAVEEENEEGGEEP